MITTLRPHGRGRFVFLCDHASNFVPPELDNLGLSQTELNRHIGWDIGAAGVTSVLSERFDSPAILSGVSRLVIDCNRHLSAHDLIPEISDGTIIPGNLQLTVDSRRRRIEDYFTSYHDAVEAVLQCRKASTIVVSIHSMTPSLQGIPRPWQIALSSHTERTLTELVLSQLRRSGDIVVGDNQPYDLDPSVDFSTPFHAIRRGWQHLQVEFRQDEVSTEAGQQSWADRFGSAIVALCEG